MWHMGLKVMWHNIINAVTLLVILVNNIPEKQLLEIECINIKIIVVSMWIFIRQETKPWSLYSNIY